MIPPCLFRCGSDFKNPVYLSVSPPAWHLAVEIPPFRGAVPQTGAIRVVFCPCGRIHLQEFRSMGVSAPPNAGFFARCTGVRGITKAAKPPPAALCAPALDDSFRVKGTLNTFTECLCSVQDIFWRLPRTVCAGQPPDNLKRACVQHSGSQTLMTAFGSYASGLWGRSRESVTFC